MGAGIGKPLCLVAALVGVLGLVVSPADAIQPGCARGGATITCSYNHNENGFLTVPPGIGQVSVSLVGGTGGGTTSGGCAPLCGGVAGVVNGTLSVTPGQRLDYFVAGNAPDSSGFDIHGAPEAFGGGGCFNGGGASAIWVDGNSTPLTVAAGGGGDGCGTTGGDPETQGGNAGAPGATGAGAGDGQGGSAGNGTTAGLGGAGGFLTGSTSFGGPGDNGAFSAGGRGGPSASGYNGPIGGGGGGGLGGGGGGGGGGGQNQGSSPSGGGGGGGSSLLPQGGSLTLDSTRVPLITLSFTSVLAFTSPPPPPAKANTSYTYSYVAVGDTEMTYAVTAGQLPSGFTLGQDGSLAGDTDTPGTYTYTVTASDGTASVSRQDTISVAGQEQQGPSSLALTCLPGTVFAGKTAICVATVANAGASGQPAPTGTVTFSSADGGTFTPQGACTLTGASCHVAFAPPSAGTGTYLIDATYDGDAGHEQASGDTFVAAAPVAGKTANVSIVRGAVLIRLPGGGTVSLGKGTRSVPLGATVDVSKGVVRLTTRSTYGGSGAKSHSTTSGVFSAGLFAARQKLARAHGSRNAVTELNLKGRANAAKKAGCRRSGPPGKGIVRSLHGVAKGLYKTVGAASETTVTTGAWTVQDRCDGTVTKVTSGHATVVVTQGHRRTVHLRAGQSLLVRARFLKAKQHLS